MRHHDKNRASEPKKRIDLPLIWREAGAIVREHRRRLALGLGLLLVGRGAGLVWPAVSKTLIDDVGGKGRADLLWTLAAIVAGATIVQASTAFALSQVLSVAAQRAINDLRERVQAHVTRLPVRYFDGTQSGVLISRIMNDAEGIRNIVGTGLVHMVGGAFTATVALCILLWLNWHLTLVLMGVFAIFGVFMAITSKKLRPIFRMRGKIHSEITGRLGESLGGIRVVKAYVAEGHEQQVFASGIGRLFANIASSITGVSAVSAVSTLAIGLIAVLMIVLGGQAMVAGQMTSGEFIQYLLYVGLMAAPIEVMASIGTQVTEAFAGLDRIREVLSVPREDVGDGARAPCPTIHGDIEFEAVTFEYEAGRPVLKSISFKTPAGTTTALVGSSGSGKSTLVSLVMAFYRPQSGVVRVDGRDLSTLKLADYRGHLGVVLQDNFLFDGTVAENVAFARPASTRAEIEDVCRRAYCDEFVRSFPNGYETIVGERGIRLSGGQRQRIAIARALLARPRILILDEATSSLDSESESYIQEGLRELRRARTTFVIAHRLSTIRSADQILVLEAGEIVERGTHAELFAARGRYRELYDRQHHLEQNLFINPGEEGAVDQDAQSTTTME